MYILLPIVMVKPIKLYTSVLIANSDGENDNTEVAGGGILAVTSTKERGGGGKAAL